MREQKSSLGTFKCLFNVFKPSILLQIRGFCAKYGFDQDLIPDRENMGKIGLAWYTLCVEFKYKT
jgi:hypothetical protein